MTPKAKAEILANLQAKLDQVFKNDTTHTRRMSK